MSNHDDPPGCLIVGCGLIAACVGIIIISITAGLLGARSCGQ